MVFYFNTRRVVVRLRWHHISIDDRGLVWEWAVRIGKWTRGEGVQYDSRDGAVGLTYWELRNEVRTNWRIQSPFSKWESGSCLW